MQTLPFDLQRIQKILDQNLPLIENPKDFDSDLEIKKQQFRLYTSNITKFIELFPDISKQYYDSITNTYSIPYKIFKDYFTQHSL